jgi:hypothetical protein
MIWVTNGKVVVNSSGAAIECDVCPCEDICPEGSSIYRVLTVDWDSGSWDETGTCACLCLIEGTIPDPLPEGKTADMYLGSYPITITGVSQKSIIGGPFTSLDECAPPTDPEDWPDTLHVSGSGTFDDGEGGEPTCTATANVSVSKVEATFWRSDPSVRPYAFVSMASGIIQVGLYADFGGGICAVFLNKKIRCDDEINPYGTYDEPGEEGMAGSATVS